MTFQSPLFVFLDFFDLPFKHCPRLVKTVECGGILRFLFFLSFSSIMHDEGIDIVEPFNVDSFNVVAFAKIRFENEIGIPSS